MTQRPVLFLLSGHKISNETNQLSRFKFDLPNLKTLISKGRETQNIKGGQIIVVPKLGGGNKSDMANLVPT